MKHRHMSHNLDFQYVDSVGQWGLEYKGSIEGKKIKTSMRRNI
jgi:hypothetical protein